MQAHWSMSVSNDVVSAIRYTKENDMNMNRTAKQGMHDSKMGLMTEPSHN